MNQNIASTQVRADPLQSQVALEPLESLSLPMPDRIQHLPQHTPIKQLRKQLGKSMQSDLAIKKTIRKILETNEAILQANRLVLKRHRENLLRIKQKQRRQTQMQQIVAKEQEEEEKKEEGIFARIKNFFAFGKTSSAQHSSSQNISAQKSESYSANWRHNTLLQQQEQQAYFIQETEPELKKNK